MKNKFIIILILFILCINLFTISSLATDITVGENVYIVPSVWEENCKDYVVFINNDGLHAVIIGSKEDLLVTQYNMNGTTKFNSSDGVLYSSIMGNIDYVFRDSFTESTSNLPRGYSFGGSYYCAYASNDIKDLDGNVIFEASQSSEPVFLAPSFITTKDELATGKFETLKIDAGDLDYNDSEFVLNIYKSTKIDETNYNYYLYKSFLLSFSSKYYYVSNLNVYYHIPRESLGIDISNDKQYIFELKEKRRRYCLF